MAVDGDGDDGHVGVEDDDDDEDDAGQPWSSCNEICSLA